MQIDVLFLRSLALVTLIGGGIVLYIAVSGPSSFPDRSVLSSVTGTAEWVRRDRYGMEFGLKGDGRTFFYASKGGELNSVVATLRTREMNPVTVLVPNEPQRPPAGEPFYQVYEVESKLGPVRTHDDIRNSWSSDYRTAYVVALLMFIMAAALEYVVRRCVPPACTAR
ncbi:hypothetical protein ACQQ2N_01295 [Dokdonella sp. MW10]|uniref:hypothetical protein n=1 Tax=Dokdonella sp. MW10 TaxID=2992926 RepID=UPI003F7FF219